MQPLQGVNSLMAMLLCFKNFDQSAVKLLQLRLLDVSGMNTNRVAVHAIISP